MENSSLSLSGELKRQQPYLPSDELDTKKKFPTIRLVKHWNGLSREAVGAPSLETFKVKLDAPLSNLIKLKTSLFTAGGWTR